MEVIRVFISYIEHLSTDTTGIISDCQGYGLRTPEFNHAEDFRTIIYRNGKLTNLDEKVTEFDEKSNRVQQKSNRSRLTAKQKKVLEFCNEKPRTTQKIWGKRLKTVSNREQKQARLIIAERKQAQPEVKIV